MGPGAPLRAVPLGEGAEGGEAFERVPPLRPELLEVGDLAEAANIDSRADDFISQTLSRSIIRSSFSVLAAELIPARFTRSAPGTFSMARKMGFMKHRLPAK